jgi:hypothetical protein
MEALAQAIVDAMQAARSRMPDNCYSGYEFPSRKRILTLGTSYV